MNITSQHTEETSGVSPRHLFLTFLYIGSTAVGVSVLQNMREVTLRKGFVTEAEFSDALAIVQTYPGPMMVNIATYIGYLRQGVTGAVVCLFGFTLPSTLLMILLGALYQNYGATPQVSHWAGGLNAVITAVLLNIALDLWRRHLKTWWQVVPAGAVAILSIAGINQNLMIFGGLIAGAFLLRGHEGDRAPGRPIVFQRYAIAVAIGVALALGLGAALWSRSLIGEIYAGFLYVGSIAFGNGVTILPVMKDVVMGNGWVTPAQFGTAIAFGQITPGPILSSATFIGYLAAGWLGGLTATVAIYAPSFAMTLVIAELFDNIKKYSSIKGAIQGAVISFCGILIGFSWDMINQYLHDINDVAAAFVVFIALSNFRIAMVPTVLSGLALWVLLDWLHL